jgi:hypoxanthine phosphoribosyltransferase
MCGAFMFAADLCRAMDVPGLTVDCVRASSYGEGTSSSGSVALSGLTTDVRGRHVLLVEDIVDTGLTIEKLKAHLEGLGAASVRVCTLLNKQSRRKNEMVPEFIGFECPDEFVVGYGLDYAGKYRELPYVGVMRQECI